MNKQKKRKTNGANGRRRANNTGTLEKRGNRWLARWYVYDVQGKRVRRSQMIDAEGVDDARRELRRLTEGDSLITREKVLRKNMDELDGIAAQRREWEDKQPSLTIEDAVKVFEADRSSKDRDKATQANYCQWFNQFARWIAAIHPEIEELRRVTPAVASEYATELIGKVRGTTFNRHMNALSPFWATLAARDVNGNPVYKDARLGGNPFAWDKRTKTGIRRVTLKHNEKPHSRRVLNLDELAQIMGAAKGEMRVLIALGFYTGLRLGDCALLRWDDIDRVNGIITTDSRKTDTETSLRVHPKLAEIIEQNVTTQSGYLLPSIAELYNGGTNGRVKLCRMIGDLFAAVGITTSFKEDGKRARPHCGFHSLRHTYVTQLERVGATLAERQRLAGHRTAAMTEHYTHDDASRVLLLPDITTEQGEPVSAAEGRFRSLCATWKMMDADERTRFTNWIADDQSKAVCK